MTQCEQKWHIRSTCRSCNGPNLIDVIDLGATPLANSYLNEDQLASERSYPLKLAYCRDCTLLQMPVTIDAELLFSEYSYLTGANEPMISHFESYARNAIRPFIHDRSDRVMDIGGNDGVLLKFVKQFCSVLNVEPAKNLRHLSESNEIEFYNAFFSSAAAEALLHQYGHPAVVTANNVFAHVDNLSDVFSGVATLVGASGVFICECHWVKNMLDIDCFDQIYHEHLCFYSLKSLNRVIEAAGLSTFRAEVVDTQGQSLRVFASRSRKPEASVSDLLKQESIFGLDSVEPYLEFSGRVNRKRDDVITLLKSLKSAGNTIVGYGAPAKGNTLLNYYNLGPSTIEYLVDSTPLKQGRYAPGTHLKIVSPLRLHEIPPDYVLVLAWNYTDAIIEKEKDLIQRGVKFILMFPELQVVESLSEYNAMKSRKANG